MVGFLEWCDPASIAPEMVERLGAPNWLDTPRLLDGRNTRQRTAVPSKRVARTAKHKRFCHLTTPRMRQSAEPSHARALGGWAFQHLENWSHPRASRRPARVASKRSTKSQLYQ